MSSCWSATINITAKTDCYELNFFYKTDESFVNTVSCRNSTMLVQYFGLVYRQWHQFWVCAGRIQHSILEDSTLGKVYKVSFYREHIYFTVCVPLALYTPQLQRTRHYIVNHYVKIWHVHLGVPIICTHQCGGHKQKWSFFFFPKRSSIPSTCLVGQFTGA